MKYSLFLFLFSLFTACVVCYTSSQPEIIATVGPNGQYATIKEAYNYLAALPKNTSVRFVVEIEPGTYTEQILVRKANFTFRPSSPAYSPSSSTPVTIQFNSPRNTSGGANNASFTVDTNADNFRMYDIILVDIAPEVQNIATTALSIGAYNTSFYGCKIYGFQDTLWFRNARSFGYFKNCYIEGGVDFIYGSGIAYFDSCTIASNRAGSITAMQGGTPTGLGTYVFHYCNIVPTLPSGPLVALANPALSYTDESQFPRSVYLGRPWDQYSRVVYQFSKLGEHIALEGWTTWQVPAGQMYGEYNNTGRGTYNPSRIATSTLLTSSQASNYTFERFFGVNPFWLDEDPQYAPQTGAPEWGQCGGYYTTETACQPPNTCRFFNEWYSQCVNPNSIPADTTSDLSQVIYNKPVGDVERLTVSNEIQGTVTWIVGAPGSNIVVQAEGSDLVAKNFIPSVEKDGTHLKIAASYYATAPSPIVDLYVTVPSNLALSSSNTTQVNGSIDTFSLTSSLSSCEAANYGCRVYRGAYCDSCCAETGGVCTATGCAEL